MFDIEKWKELLVAVSVAVGHTLRSGLQLLGSPCRFHLARMEEKSSRLSESIRFGGLASALMVLLYFVTVSAVITVKQPVVFLVAGGALNFTHMVMLAIIYSVSGKLAAWRVPARIHFENVFYATALLPVVAFLSQPVAHVQVKALLAEHSAFAFGYRAGIAEALTNSSLAAWSAIGIAAAYLFYFSYLIYAGLRVTAGLPRWRAAAAVIPGTIGLFFYQSIVLLPITQQFVHATTR